MVTLNSVKTKIVTSAESNFKAEDLNKKFSDVLQTKSVN